MAKNKDKSNESDCLEDEKNFVNARMAITQQLNENKEFLKAAVEKMNKMGTKISLL